MTEELNRKLAEWAGFKGTKVRRYLVGGSSELVNGWEAPDGKLSELRPNFTASLDACFKWLVPKLGGWMMRNYDFGTAAVVWIDNEESYKAIAETPALALCKAIEQLIDEEQK